MNLGLDHDGRAYGGAVTGLGNVVTGPGQYGLLWQVHEDNYTPDVDTISNTLFTVWAGGNDLRSITDPNDAPGVINSAIGNIEDAITSLYGAGARNILIPNLPDLGITPEVNWNLALSGAASFASGIFNQELGTMIDSLSFSGLNIFELDVFTYLNDVIIPGEFFANITDPWIGSGESPSEYLFFDGIHPTTEGHWRLSEYAAQTINDATNSVPVPAAVWLLGSGILCLAGIRRKTR